MTKRLVPDPEIEDLIRELNVSARAAEEPAEEPDEPAEDAAAAATTAAAPVPARPRTRWRLPQPSDAGHESLARLLGRARKADASDLLLVASAPAGMRANGRLDPLGKRKLTGDETARLCAALVPPARREALLELGSVDFSFSLKGLGRFRSNVHRERSHWAAAIRLFPDTAPELEALNLPSALGRFAELEHGLVLVTGPTGSGKSTTLAALVQRVLSRRRVHLITIEDPVEYEHPHGDSIVEHIEIGRDVPTYAQALRSALRQDPDVILIGEMRDMDSISIAITAGETGHLVLSTLHTGDAPQTIHRIVDTYPPTQQDAVRAQLSVSLAGVVSQQLLPKADGKGRVPAVEILMCTHAVRNLIRQNKVPQIRSQVTLERAAGMLSLDRSLADLARAGLVDAEEARTRSRTPTEFEALLGKRG